MRDKMLNMHAIFLGYVSFVGRLRFISLINASWPISFDAKRFAIDALRISKSYGVEEGLF